MHHFLHFSIHYAYTATFVSFANPNPSKIFCFFHWWSIKFNLPFIRHCFAFYLILISSKKVLHQLFLFWFWVSKVESFWKMDFRFSKPTFFNDFDKNRIKRDKSRFFTSKTLCFQIHPPFADSDKWFPLYISSKSSFIRILHTIASFSCPTTVLHHLNASFPVLFLFFNPLQ